MGGSLVFIRQFATYVGVLVGVSLALIGGIGMLDGALNGFELEFGLWAAGGIIATGYIVVILGFHSDVAGGQAIISYSQPIQIEPDPAVNRSRADSMQEVAGVIFVVVGLLWASALLVDWLR